MTSNILQYLLLRQAKSYLLQMPQQIPMGKTQHDKKIPNIADDPHISSNTQSFLPSETELKKYRKLSSICLSLAIKAI